MPTNIVVPMCTVVQYKGFSAFVNINLNFKETEIAYGASQGKFIAEPELVKSMALVGKRLNIMPHTHKSRTQSGALIEVPLS